MMAKQMGQVKKWGNSHAIRIPKQIMADLNLTENTMLEISVDKEQQQVILNVDDGLTPYQRLVKNSKPSEKVTFRWDDREGEMGLY